MTPVFRFAPSPNGLLHLGHAYSALLNADLARRFGGRLILRIEDIDAGRCRPHYEAAIYRDLAWLGLRWEEPVRRQSEHLDDYRAAAARLAAMGLLYPCFCSRREIAEAAERRAADQGGGWPTDPDGAPLYGGHCRSLTPAIRAARLRQGVPHALRLDMQAAFAAAPGRHGFTRFAADGGEEAVAADPAVWGDAVIVRRDIPTSYHLAVVVDDAIQGVTHVVRGADLEAATGLHLLLQRLLRLASPRYHHHRLIRGRDGEKLSKSLGSRSLAELRAAGLSAGDLRQALGLGEA